MGEAVGYHLRRERQPARSIWPIPSPAVLSGENEKIAASGEIWGRPRSNVYAGEFPAVKAWNGPLPDGVAGTEFYTDVEPDPWCVPSAPSWSEGRPGVATIERKQLVSIRVVVTKQVPAEQTNANSKAK
jgi:hypothetical protein